jgi:hypothetical protein
MNVLRSVLSKDETKLIIKALGHLELVAGGEENALRFQLMAKLREASQVMLRVEGPNEGA